MNNYFKQQYLILQITTTMERGVVSCMICNSTDGYLVQIKNRGMNTLISSSKKRRNKFKMFQKISEGDIHDNCGALYNKPSAIASAAADNSKRKSDLKKL